MPRRFRAMVLPLLLAPSLSLAQRPDRNLHIVIPTTSITRPSSEAGTRGHFWKGAAIGAVGGALIGGVIGSTTEFCLDSCTHEQARSGAIAAGIIVGAPAGFLIGGIIGSLIRSDRSSISVGPRLGALGLTVDVRF